MSRILVTGGLGFIGSHTVVELLKKGFEVTVVDNLSNSKRETVDAICKITSKSFEFYELDVTNYSELTDKLKDKSFEYVIHFAAYKAVGESVKNPLKYYQNNIVSLLNIIELMRQLKIGNLLFSSSATVYGNQSNFPINENSSLNKPNSPYGITKLVGEYILEDAAEAYGLKTVALRYFNPIGAHPSGLIGESPNGIPNNLLPYITKVAKGELKELTIYGDDYDTPDGTCIRDYIDVCDLADAHVRIVERTDKIKNNFNVYNVGTNKGTTVLEIIHAFEKANNLNINYKIGSRREGDVEKMYCDYSKISQDFGWEPMTKLEESLKNSWRWENK